MHTNYLVRITSIYVCCSSCNYLLLLSNARVTLLAHCTPIILLPIGIFVVSIKVGLRNSVSTAPPVPNAPLKLMLVQLILEINNSYF
jgi:hypothetical protein